MCRGAGAGTRGLPLSCAATGLIHSPPAHRTVPLLRGSKGPSLCSPGLLRTCGLQSAHAAGRTTQGTRMRTRAPDTCGTQRQTSDLHSTRHVPPLSWHNDSPSRMGTHWHTTRIGTHWLNGRPTRTDPSQIGSMTGRRACCSSHAQPPPSRDAHMQKGPGAHTCPIACAIPADHRARGRGVGRARVHVWAWCGPCMRARVGVVLAVHVCYTQSLQQRFRPLCTHSPVLGCALMRGSAPCAPRRAPGCAPHTPSLPLKAPPPGT